MQLIITCVSTDANKNHQKSAENLVVSSLAEKEPEVPSGVGQLRTQEPAPWTEATASVPPALASFHLQVRCKCCLTLGSRRPLKLFHFFIARSEWKLERLVVAYVFSYHEKQYNPCFAEEEKGKQRLLFFFKKRLIIGPN